MIEFISNHKVFSGIGTAIIMLIIGKMWPSKSKPTLNQKSGNNSKNYQAGGDIHLGDKSEH